jgi:hypothetical protein
MGLTSWPRPHFKAGGGNALMMYQVFGSVTGPLDISEAKHRTTGMPAGVKIQYHDRERHADAFGWFKPGYLWECLQKENPDLARAVDAAPGCLRIQGNVADPSTLDYFRDVVGVITAALEKGATVVFDPQMFKWWSPAEWRARVFDPDGPVPRHHVVTLTSEEEEPKGTEWIHTRGMRKFGRPDLSIHAVPKAHREAMIDLCDRFIELQAFGGLIPEGQVIRMSSLPQGLTCHHGGDLEDPDFNNVHVEVRWPQSSH